MLNSNYQFIDSESKLTSLLESLSDFDKIALDTEFMRTNTYHAKPGLIQIGCDHGNYLIDPLSAGNLEGLAPSLSDPSTVKVMHSMSEDVELLYRVSGTEMQNVFDTQIAAAFMGYGVSLGYQKLVAVVLGVELDKSETRSDWLARPLSESQLNYAALDVEYLLEVYDTLRDELLKKGMLEAALEESSRVVETVHSNWKNPDQAYLKLRGGCELNINSQRLLQHLVLWRDGLAVSKDIPKPWIFNDASLISVAERKPSTLSDLKRIKGMQFKSVKKHGDALINLLSEFECDESLPFTPIDKPVRGRELDYYQRLKSMIAQVSEETGIEKQLLGSRKLLENLVIRIRRHRDSELPAEYQGWRKPLLAKRIEEILEV